MYLQQCFPPSKNLSQFWFDAELQSVNGAVKDTLKRYGGYNEEVKEPKS